MNAPRLRAQQEPSCRTAALWRLAVVPGHTLDPGRVPEWRSWPHPLEPALHLWRHAAGHQLLWVAASGRWQLRLDLAVPPAERTSLAARLVAELSAAVVPDTVD